MIVCACVWLRALARDGLTMLVVTHEMDFAREVSHRVLVLHGGEVIEEGPPRAVLDAPTVSARGGGVAERTPEVAVEGEAGLFPFAARAKRQMGLGGESPLGGSAHREMG